MMASLVLNANFFKSEFVQKYFRFALVGGLASFVYYALLIAMVELFEIPVLIATSIAFTFVTIENYYLHRVWTFKSNKAHEVAFPQFVIMSVVGFILNGGIMYFGVEVFQYNYLLVQALAIIVVVLWNVILSSMWIFAPVTKKQG